MRFRDQNPIMMEEINADFGWDQKPQSRQVTNLLMDFGLVDPFQYIRQLLQLCHLKTWFHVWQDRLLRE